MDSLAQRTSAFQTILEVTTDDSGVDRANRFDRFSPEQSRRSRPRPATRARQSSASDSTRRRWETRRCRAGTDWRDRGCVAPGSRPMFRIGPHAIRSHDVTRGEDGASMIDLGRAHRREDLLVHALATVERPTAVVVNAVSDARTRNPDGIALIVVWDDAILWRRKLFHHRRQASSRSLWSASACVRSAPRSPRSASLRTL